MTGVQTCALPISIETLAKTTSGTLLFVFALVHLALLRIKLRQRTVPNGFIVPLWVPVAGFVISISFLLVQLATL